MRDVDPSCWTGGHSYFILFIYLFCLSPLFGPPFVVEAFFATGFFFGLLAINSEGVLLQYGEQRGRAVSGDSSFFFRVLQKEPVGGGEVCLRVGDSYFFEEPWRENKKETSRRGAGRRKEGWPVFEVD